MSTTGSTNNVYEKKTKKRDWQKTKRRHKLARCPALFSHTSVDTCTVQLFFVSTTLHLLKSSGYIRASKPVHQRSISFWQIRYNDLPLSMHAHTYTQWQYYTNMHLITHTHSMTIPVPVIRYSSSIVTLSSHVRNGIKRHLVILIHKVLQRTSISNYSQDTYETIATWPHTRNCRMLIRRSDSLKPYGMFQPRGPNLRRSWTRAWKKHRPKRSFSKAWTGKKNRILALRWGTFFHK